MATFQNRIVVREGKGLNPSKYFFTTFEVTSSETQYVPARADKLSPLGFTLQNELEAIPGVSGVSITKWEIRVHKVKAYKWSEVYPQVVETLKEVLQDYNYKLAEENWLSLVLKRTLSSIRSILR